MNTSHYPFIDRAAHCLRTYSTLRIYPKNLSSDTVDQTLALPDTRLWRKSAGKPFNGVFFTTKGRVNSLNTLDHISFLLDHLEQKQQAIADIIADGGHINIINFWHSDGQGGPGLSLEIMQRLCALGIAIDWNVYAKR